MDITRRKITKIAREVSRFADRTLRAPGVGSAEYDLINLVRQNPGITQKELSRILGVDKSTVARQAANLEKKGYIERTENPADGFFSEESIAKWPNINDRIAAFSQFGQAMRK